MKKLSASLPSAALGRRLARQGLVTTALASTLALLSHPATATTTADDDYVDCKGVNACKGLSDCNRSNCRGRNACKGQGFKILSVSECQKAQAALKPRSHKAEKK
ncbi:hypothetical protein [Niveibacterium sp. SC-1]|uniref:BufA2 family periplasmic bufferin-type metallophore n=1 Tax=Niveibacterium sp. SC-1 TaxID=3135646 RepID=UPI00311FBAF8